MKEIHYPIVFLSLISADALWSRGPNVCYSSNHRDQTAQTWQEMPHPFGLAQALFL